MKILLAQSTVYVPTHGGENKANRLLLEGLAARGHECRVISPACGAQGPGARTQFLHELSARGLKVTASEKGVDVFCQNHVEVHAITDAATMRTYLADQLARDEPTWTLISSEDPGQVLLETALRATPSRVVYVAHTMLFFPCGPNSFFHSPAKTELLRQAAGVITVSRYLQQYLKEWAGCESAVIPFPVYGDGPFPRWGSFDSGSITLVNPCTYKGLPIFLELARRFPDQPFLAVPSWGTTGSDRAALAALPNVRTVEAVDDIDQLFAQTRVLLVPSLWGEGFPLVPVEAMLRGLPVLASDSGGLPESKLGIDYVLPVRPITEYQPRFDDRKLPVAVVPEQNIAPWADALGELITDRARYESLSAASRDAALAYVGGLGIAPFEQFLEQLQPASAGSRLAAHSAGADAATPDRERDEERLREQIGALSPERRALLARRLVKKGAVARIPRAARHPGSEGLPLSFAQERLWFLDQIEPGNVAYNLLDAFRLQGRLNTEALQQSLVLLANRHEMLRTTFRARHGRPEQHVAPQASPPLELIATPTFVASERELYAVVREEARRPFDLERGPLVRASLLQRSREEHVLVLVMHHIVSDGWSADILFREIRALYESCRDGVPPRLPELPIQYADYAVWQRNSLATEQFAGHVSYWKAQLAGAPALLQLPTDRPRPAVQTFRGARQAITLTKSLTQAVKELSRREAVTPFIVLLAAFKALLFRYTAQDDLLVGCPVAGRTRVETEGLIGFFVNTLVMRTRVQGDVAFRELLGQVKQVATSAYAHQDLPFEKLVETLQPERNLSHSPLFQVAFVLQNAPRAGFELPELKVTPLDIDYGVSKFDLTLDVVERPEGLVCAFEYNLDLFDPDTILRMLGHWRTLLEGIARDPGQSVAELPILSRDERHRLLVGWNQTEQPYDLNRCLHELIEAQVKRTPSATAVIFDQERRTYAELNARANRLARRLQTLGVGPGVLVGIYMKRSIEMVEALLATLKAGGAYVPLDPSYPSDRVAFMIEDAQAPVLLTQRRLLSSLHGQQATVLCLDPGADVLHNESASDRPSGVRPEDLAYVIYTSGSTGKPKGAMNTHRGICNRLLWMQEAYRLTETDRILQKTPFSFDVSVWEFFWPLMAGARLVMARPGGHQDAQYLTTVIRQQAITTMHFVPSMLNVFLEEPGFAGCRSLRQVMCSGEALPYELQERFFARSTAALHNLYGPTEAAVDVTAWACQRQGDRRIVPIGRPIANIEVYVLDERLEPVPIGVAGELHIGGVGLARGYWKRPDLTAEKFIPHPFRTDPGARLYKTGDLVRYLPEGNIEYLGRLDHQVKLRGFRIELGEIESALASQSSVREAVVVAREDQGRKRLVAYIVPRADAVFSVDELRSALARTLPEYMVPAAFVELPSLPLTPSGKVDRRALPAPSMTMPAGAAYVPPATHAEEVLAGIWAQVLRIPQVGVEDNFFELGGDSILSIQVVARANQAGLRLTPKQLFAAQTVRGLAALAGRVGGGTAEQGAVSGPVPLTPVQRWFFEERPAEPHHWNLALLLKVPSVIDTRALHEAVQALERHHDALRLRFRHENHPAEQLDASLEANAVFECVDLQGMTEGAARQFLERRAAHLQGSFDLEAGPLLRVAHFDRGPQQSGRLLIVVHHLAIDGVSWRILLEDLQTAYEQVRTGRVVQLPPKTTSFKQWAERLVALASTRALDHEFEYWLGALSGSDPTIPVDRTGGSNLVGAARTAVVELDKEETRALLHEVPGVYRTQINDVLLTALVQAVGQWSGQPRVLVDLEGHGREEILDGVDVSRTVGWFTSVFPVNLELDPAMTPGEALKAVKEQLRAIPQRGIGYGILRYLAPPGGAAERLRNLAPARVLFNYLGQFDAVLPQSSMFRWAAESPGPFRSPHGSRRYLLEINAQVLSGRLRVEWTYGSQVHQRSTIESVANEYLSALRSLIAHCRSPHAGGFTPSDFPQSALKQNELDELLAELD